MNASKKIPIMGGDSIELSPLDQFTFRKLLVRGNRGGLLAGLTLSKAQLFSLAEALLPDGYVVSREEVDGPLPIPAYNAPERCPKCGGDGFWHMSVAPEPGLVVIRVDRTISCPTCHGTGWSR